MAMDYSALQAVVAATDAAYAAGNDSQKQQAVADRQAAVAAYEAYRDSLTPTPSNPSPTSYSPSPPPPPPAPLLPTFRPMLASNTSVKVAPSDIVQFDDSTVSVAMMQDLLFEDIGAVELANISRSDLVDGQQTIYSPIKNLSSVRKEFNPNTIVATAYNADYFTRFGIDLLSRGISEPYFDANGDLIIEVDRMLSGEEIQVQVLANGTIETIEES